MCIRDRESTAAYAANAAPRASLKQRLAALGDAQPPTATRSRRAAPGEAAADGSGAFFAAVAGAAALAFAALLVAATFGGRRGERGSDAERRVLLAEEDAV